MIKKINILFFSLILISCLNIYGENKKLDSLLKVFNKTKSDSVSINLCITIGDLYESTNPDSAIIYYKKGLSLAKKINDKRSESTFLRYIGIIFYCQGNFDTAIETLLSSLSVDSIRLAKPTDLKAKRTIQSGMADCYNNIGIINRAKGSYETSVKYYLKSLEINEELLSKTNDKDKIYGFKQSIAACYNNIGNVYNSQNSNDKAIDYYSKSLVIRIEINDMVGIAASYTNIGSINQEKKKFSVAKDYFFKALTIVLKLNDRKYIGVCYNNIGQVCSKLGDNKKAMEYYQMSLKIREEIGDKNGSSNVINNIAELYVLLKNYKEAINFSEKNLIIAKEIGALEIEKNAYKHLSTSYEHLNNPLKALKYYKLFYEINDSLFNTEKLKQFSDLETKYQTDKKQKEIQILEKDKKIKIVEINRQKIFRNSFIVGFALMILLTIVIFKSYRQKKKANILLASQKKIIEEKNEELNQYNEEIRTQRDEIQLQKNFVVKQKNELENIYEEQTDSIIYAQRIQQAVLPMKDYLDQFLKEYFILSKPKNIVSGDFFWITNVNKWTLFCVADCTGHGVPGAFMSMLGIALLNEIVRQEEITKASHVLDQLRKRVIESLKQRGVKGEQQDGMDIAFCALNSVTLEIQFAGANNPCYVITKTSPVIARRCAEPVEARNDEAISYEQSDCFVPFDKLSASPRNDDNFTNFKHFDKLNTTLYELKGDKQPIGIHTNMQPFTNQIYQLKKGDIIYLMSDGYEDQFGGPNRKKFLSKNLKNLLTANSQKPIADQKQILENTITEWIGDGEQIDDITILGIKI